MQVYGYEYGFRWWALLIVASYTVGFTVLAVVFLKYVSFLKREGMGTAAPLLPPALPAP